MQVDGSFCCFSKMKGSDNQEKLVYQIIEDAGNKGDNQVQYLLPLGAFSLQFGLHQSGSAQVIVSLSFLTVELRPLRTEAFR